MNKSGKSSMGTTFKKYHLSVIFSHGLKNKNKPSQE